MDVAGLDRSGFFEKPQRLHKLCVLLGGFCMNRFARHALIFGLIGGLCGLGTFALASHGHGGGGGGHMGGGHMGGGHMGGGHMGGGHMGGGHMGGGHMGGF